MEVAMQFWFGLSAGIAGMAILTIAAFVYLAVKGQRKGGEQKTYERSMPDTDPPTERTQSPLRYN